MWAGRSYSFRMVFQSDHLGSHVLLIAERERRDKRESRHTKHRADTQWAREAGEMKAKSTATLTAANFPATGPQPLMKTSPFLSNVFCYLGRHFLHYLFPTCPPSRYPCSSHTTNSQVGTHTWMKGYHSAYFLACSYVEGTSLPKWREITPRSQVYSDNRMTDKRTTNAQRSLQHPLRDSLPNEPQRQTWYNLKSGSCSLK